MSAIVYEGEYKFDSKTTMLVAVKCIEKSKIKELGIKIEEFLENEFKVINRLKHKNIVEYFAMKNTITC